MTGRGGAESRGAPRGKNGNREIPVHRGMHKTTLRREEWKADSGKEEWLV